MMSLGKWSKYGAVFNLGQGILNSCSFKQNQRFLRTLEKGPTWRGLNSSKKKIGGGDAFQDLKMVDRLVILRKPLVFTVAFSSGTIAVCAVWQYESERNRMIGRTSKYNPSLDIYHRDTKNPKWRRELHNAWRDLSVGEKLFVPICFANCLVFLAWRIPKFRTTMLRHFCSNTGSDTTCWPLLLSTFSHYDIFHLGINMFVLHSFSTLAVDALGREQFLAFYLTSGVISSFASFSYRVLRGKSGLSLGASGAIYAVLGFICFQYPETQLKVIFVPTFTFSAGAAIKFIIGLDLMGLILGWSFFDHVAHLGGVLYGIGWHYIQLWEKLVPFWQWWHKMRSTGRSQN